MQPSSGGGGGGAGLTRPPNGQTGKDQCGDPALPALTAVLCAAGAGECWHKHSTFLAHLLEVYRILRLWAAPDAVARCGLYHSAYSNSYVNLAIFEPDVGRGRVAAAVGDEAERLAHLFCVIPRQQLFHYDDADLTADLARSEESLLDARHWVFHDDEPWRRKIQRLLPANGITVKHIRDLEMALEEENEIRVKSSVLAAARSMWGGSERCCLRQWEEQSPQAASEEDGLARLLPSGAVLFFPPFNYSVSTNSNKENQALLSTKFVPLHLQGLWMRVVFGILVHVLLFVAITLRTNWKNEQPC